MAIVRALNGVNFKSGYAWKGLGLLLLIAAVAAALFVGPALRRAPDSKSLINLPAMSNPPPAGSFHIEPAAPEQ